MAGTGRGCGRRLAHEQGERDEGGEDRRQAEEDVAEGHDQRLFVGALVQERQRHRLGGVAMIGEALRQRREILLGDPAAGRDGLVQAGDVQVGAVVEQGVDQREPDRAAEIAVRL